MRQKIDSGPPMSLEFAAPTPTAVWACRSRFCLYRGPFWVRSVKDAQAQVARHRARKFLGVFGHDALAGPIRGQSFIAFLRDMRLAPKAMEAR